MNYAKFYREPTSEQLERALHAPDIAGNDLGSPDRVEAARLRATGQTVGGASLTETTEVEEVAGSELGLAGNPEYMEAKRRVWGAETSDHSAVDILEVVQ